MTMIDRPKHPREIRLAEELEKLRNEYVLKKEKLEAISDKFSGMYGERLRSLDSFSEHIADKRRQLRGLSITLDEEVEDREYTHLCDMAAINRGK